MHTTMRELRNHATKFGLERARCTDCGRINDPTAEHCYQCGRSDLDDMALSPEGKVITFVVQHYLPPAFTTPLPIAIVETPEGGKLLGTFTEVTDPHDIAIGDRVHIEPKRFNRHNGHIQYEMKFKRSAEATE